MFLAKSIDVIHVEIVHRKRYVKQTFLSYSCGIALSQNRENDLQSKNAETMSFCDIPACDTLLYFMFIFVKPSCVYA